MKGFFKKHPELLILLIVVIAIDAFIVWMWLDDLAATEKSKQAHQKIKNDAIEINESPWRINTENAKIAEDESVNWQKVYDKLIEEKQNKYAFTIDYKKTDQPATAKRLLKEKVDHMSDELLKDKDKTNKLSFFTYAYENTLMSMKTDEIETVYVVLKGLEELVKACVTADIVSMDEVVRPNDLAFVEDKSIGTRRYTYNLTVSATAEGLKKLINEIVNNEKFFFEINSLKLEAIPQITSTTSDHIPLVKRQGNTAATNQSPKRGGRGLEAELENLIDPGTGATNEVDPDEPVIYKDSVSPFSQAVNKVVISIDWVQYIKE